jgi:hypothetical protein
MYLRRVGQCLRVLPLLEPAFKKIVPPEAAET